MPKNVDMQILLVIMVYIFAVIWIYLCYFSDPEPSDRYLMDYNENFVGKYDDSDTALLEIRLNEELESPMKYMTTQEFDEMIAKIRKIVYQDIIKYSKMCSEMNGDDGPQPNQMTLKCNTDPQGMQEDIVNHIAEYIIDHIKKTRGVNLNPYQVTGDFMIHLNLLEDVIYPLMYSDLYTVHGIQYFDKNILGEKVYYNLMIRDVLFTTLLRRGIEVIDDQDNQP